MQQQNVVHRPGTSQRAVTAVVAGLAAVATPWLLATSASAETRGYVVSWLATATNNPDFAVNCPELAKNPDVVKGLENTGRAPDRAAVNGQAVPPLDYPDAVQKDPNIETVVGKYAYGFDLGGPAANKFEDPETHQPVDNQLWRAVGCTKSFQATPPSAPYPEEVSWATMVDTSPGYAMQISGADLSRDGPVTVMLDRTLRHVERDATGGVRSNVTYALDPSPRSHNVFSGEIRNGMLLIKSGTLYLAGDMPFYAQVDLKQTHMRMGSETGGKLVGYWGGYTDWHTWVYMYTARPGSGADGVGFYRALEKLADADPDPATGRNRMISTTWRVEAVPAYLATADGKVVARASSEGLGGQVHATLASTAGAQPDTH
jgi:hypothetical protein